MLAIPFLMAVTVGGSSKAFARPRSATTTVAASVLFLSVRVPLMSIALFDIVKTLGTLSAREDSCFRASIYVKLVGPCNAEQRGRRLADEVEDVWTNH